MNVRNRETGSLFDKDMMKRRLIIFTDGFPYGKGEKPFILPELEALRLHYNITIVAVAAKDLFANTENTTALPSDIQLLKIETSKLSSLLLGSLSMPLTENGRKELARISTSTASLPLRMKRIAESAWQYGLAQSIKAHSEKLHLFEGADETIYYTFWLNHCNLALALKKQELPHLALVSRIHGYDLYDERARFGRQPFQWLKLKETDKIVFAAQGAMDHFALKHELDEAAVTHKLTLSRIGSSAAAPASASQQIREKPLIVSCSNVIPLKRIDLLIEALSLLKELDIAWVHFGDGPELESLKALAQDCSLDARFEGYRSNEELKEFYLQNQVDLFVTVTSTEGGCPVSITEALAFGIPVIGTNVGGIPEQIDGNGILLSETPTPKEVANAIRTLLTQPSTETERMRIRSQEIFKQRFDATANLAALIDALNAARKN